MIISSARCAPNQMHPAAQRDAVLVMGISVGHYEGDELVVDTVGIR